MIIELKDSVIQRRFTKKCMHNKFIVDSSLNIIECGICGENLNPIWVLGELAKSETRYSMRLKELEKLAHKAEKKNKCKCEHCGKMTKIQRR